MSTFDRLFDPRGIAVVGASDNPARGGGQPLNALLANGYGGRIFPVNPNRAEIRGLKCYANLRDIGEPCDLAVIALPAPRVPEAVRDCGAAGIPFAVVYSGGFREAGPAGAALESDMLRAAREGGVRLIGPNCLGVVNVPQKVYAAFGSLSRPPLLKAGSVSIISQSGGLSHSIAMSCAPAGAGFRYLVSSGNEADITTVELIDACLDDEATRIVLAYTEGVSDGRALMAAGRKAARLGKAVLIWKVGNTASGARAAASHTANMTGSYDIYRAAFRQAGLIEVRGFDDFADLIKAFATGRLPAGPRLALVSASGGVCILISDYAETHGLVMPQPEAATLAVLGGTVADMGVGAGGNAMDIPPGFLNDGSEHKLQAAVDALLADANIDQLCVMLMTIQGRQALNAARALAAAAARSAKPILVFSAALREVAAEAFAVLEAAGIPVFASPTRLAYAAATTVETVRTRARLAGAEAPRAEPPAPQWSWPAGGALNELDSKRLLRAYGVATTQDAVVPVGDAGRAGGFAFPAPYAVKILSADIPHKSDVQGVRLNLRDDAEVRAAMAGILAAVGRAAPAAKLEGLFVSEMVEHGFETLIGVVNDPSFGPVVAFGIGGIFTELLRDVSYRVAPFGVNTALAMIRELRAAAVFEGARGQPALDVDALARMLASVSELAWALRDRVREIDINPVLVRPRGQGAVVADALVILQDESASSRSASDPSDTHRGADARRAVQPRR